MKTFDWQTELAWALALAFAGVVVRYMIVSAQRDGA